MVAAADSNRRGGIALLVRENDLFAVENEKVRRGLNVILFELMISPDER